MDRAYYWKVTGISQKHPGYGLSWLRGYNWSSRTLKIRDLNATSILGFSLCFSCLHLLAYWLTSFFSIGYLFPHSGWSRPLELFCPVCQLSITCGYWALKVFSSAQFSRSVMSDSLQPLEPQHVRLPCPSPTAGACSNSCPSSWWCHTAVSSCHPFLLLPSIFPINRSLQMSQLFASAGQSIGVSASTSVLPMNTQDWSPLGWTGWISLQSKGLSRVFSNTTVQKHQFFGTQLSL